jgi:hypothetical protein
MAFSVVAVQRDHRIAAARQTLARRAVDEQDVEVAVVVVVEERRAVAVGVDDVVLGGVAVDVEQGEAGVSSDVDEFDRAWRGGGESERGAEKNKRQGARCPLPFALCPLRFVRRSRSRR